MWKTVRLGGVCNLIGGGTPSKRNPEFYGGDIPWATVRDMYADVLDETEHTITEEGLSASSSKVIPKGRAVIASRVGLGKVCLLGQDTAINQDLRGIIPFDDDKIDTKYLFYWLKSVAEYIISSGRGATVHGVTLPFLKNLSLPLPPLAEQKRIVERLDKAFAEIDKAIATAEAKAGEVERLVSETIRQVFQRGGENKKKNFAEVCVLQRGFDLPKKDRSSGIYPLYSANGITDYISAPKVLGPAVITGRSGTIGKVHYSENDIWPLNTALYVKDFKGNFPKYVYYFLRSFKLKKYASGTGVPTLNRNILKHESVYVCEGSDRQENKCRILDKIEGEVSKISHIQKGQLDLLRRLKASILKEELTPSEAV